MANFNSARNDAYPANRKERRRFTMHSGIDEVFTGMLKKRSGRKKATETQERNDQQQEIISNAVSSDDDICKETNSDLSDYQHIDQTQLISQKDSDMNSVNENTAQSTDTQYDELRKHLDHFDNHISKADTMIEKKKPFKNVLMSFNEINQSHGEIEAFGYKNTYQMLQIAYKISIYILGDCLNEFVNEARIRGINFEDKADFNVFLPIVKTLWGRFESVNVKGNPEEKWQHNRSCEKYSSVFKHLKDNGVPPNEVASYIEKFGGIRKIVEAVTEKNGKVRYNGRNDDLESNTLENRIIAKKSRPIGTFRLSSGKCKEHVAYFLGKVGSDGMVSIYEELEISNGNLRASLKAAADK